MLKRYKFRRELPLYVMLVLPVIVLVIYLYGPMFGLVMAFQRFEPSLGFFRSEWVGLDNFRRLLYTPGVGSVVTNTLYIAIMKIVTETCISIMIAILLNEIISKWFKRTVQTIIYFPYFLSWVILGGVLRDILAREGIVNKLLETLGIESILFLGKPALFPIVLVITENWQLNGFNTIIFLAAITSISPTLYEAASIDGAGWFRKTWHITIPGMSSTIILMLTLSMGYILNAGFDQILMLYSPLVYSTGDVIDTWVYRAGLQQAQYSLATSVGLFRSVVSFSLITLSYYIAKKYYGYRIF